MRTLERAHHCPSQAISHEVGSRYAGVKERREPAVSMTSTARHGARGTSGARCAYRRRSARPLRWGSPTPASREALGTTAALAVTVVVGGCNLMWGIDELEYAGDDQGGAATAAPTGSAGSGGTSSGGSGVTSSGTGVAGSAGSAAGPVGGAGGAGGGPCSEPCDDPPNDVCYQPTGTCNPSTGECSYTRLADGTECAATSCGSYGSCSWSSECSNAGTRYRTCTDYECSAGTCAPSTRQESDPCSRTVSNGTACSAGYCCANVCVARNDHDNCGSCGISCGTLSCVALVAHPGQYSCNCFTNDFCRNAGFGALATCWHDGIQSACNCQCSTGSSCTGQCAGGGICADVSGHNYCHY